VGRKRFLLIPGQEERGKRIAYKWNEEVRGLSSSLYLTYSRMGRHQGGGSGEEGTLKKELEQSCSVQRNIAL